MIGMEAMAANMLGKMLGMTQEEMAAKVGDFGAAIGELATRLEVIETNTLAILKRMEAMENDGGNGSGKRSVGGRKRLAAPAAGSASDTSGSIGS